VKWRFSLVLNKHRMFYVVQTQDVQDLTHSAEC